MATGDVRATRWTEGLLSYGSHNVPRMRNRYPRVRDSVKILLLDELGHLLLLRAKDQTTGATVSYPVGGGLEKGEDVHSAARREVAEETGLADITLGPEVWRRRQIYSWRGRDTANRERWFLARVPHFEPSPAGLTEDEQEDVTGFRWWAPAELATTTETVFPPDLGERLVALLGDSPPEVPIDIST